MLPEAKEVAAFACEADPSKCKSRQATHLLSGCSLVRLKALPCRGRDRGSESLHPGQLSQLLRDRQTGKVATL
jgi:hypothetical protein